jgi:hypothetical protein
MPLPRTLGPARRKADRRFDGAVTGDELDYHAVENGVLVADRHATILHLFGLDHKRVTYRVHGRDERLTDVYDAWVVKTLLVG